MNQDITIVKLTENDLEDAAKLLTDAMCTNPNHLAIFKSTNAKAKLKQYKMFVTVLSDKHTTTYTAKYNNKIVGVMSYTHSAHCQLKPIDLIRIIPKILNIFGKHFLLVLQWRALWGRYDYKKPHVHFGPIAVDVQHQGRGIGKMLLKHFINHLEKTKEIGYLETDKRENVELYQNFGFEIIATAKFKDTQNWFMIRK
jgi:ribosomal protein S18 acetylase RimI-like enzyme